MWNKKRKENKLKTKFETKFETKSKAKFEIKFVSRYAYIRYEMICLRQNLRQNLKQNLKQNVSRKCRITSCRNSNKKTLTKWLFASLNIFPTSSLAIERLMNKWTKSIESNLLNRVRFCFFVIIECFMLVYNKIICRNYLTTFIWTSFAYSIHSSR